MVDSNLSPLIIKYERILEEDPRSRVFAPLAEAYRKVGLLDNAFATLKKGLRYNPDYLLGYLTLAQCYMDKGEANLSYSTLRPLVSQNRDNIKLQKLFGESAVLTDNKEEALDTFKYLLYLQPKDQDVAAKVAQLESELEEGPIYNSPVDVKFDVDELRPSPELDRSLDDWVQVDLSQSDEENEDDEDDYVEASTIDEWSAEEEDEVEDEYELVAEAPREEPVPVITHTLVDLYIKQGHKEKAIELLEKINEIQPENRETIERLESLRAELGVKNPDSLVDEGRDNLMAAFDNTKANDLADEDFESTPVADEGKLAEVLQDFAGMLKNRAENILRD